MITKLALALSLAGAAMLITGLLPQNKMDKVRGFLGDTGKHENQPPVRLQLLVCGASCLFIGLLMLGVVRL
jgi:hypothetical protein